MIIAEMDRATSKHDWTDYTLAQMLDAVFAEDKELKEAVERGDVRGEHGIIAEALQGVVTRIRMIEALKQKGPSVNGPINTTVEWDAQRKG